MGDILHGWVAMWIRSRDVSVVSTPGISCNVGTLQGWVAVWVHSRDELQCGYTPGMSCNVDTLQERVAMWVHSRKMKWSEWSLLLNGETSYRHKYVYEYFVHGFISATTLVRALHCKPPDCGFKFNLCLCLWAVTFQL